MSEADKGLEETRAALAPTLEATAAILPWVAKPKEPRFPPDIARKWQDTCEVLARLWSGRHERGLPGFRTGIFGLCAVALELGDIDCLRLSEALASATDRLEESGQLQDPRLVAALSATLESLSTPESLEHATFSERARHFAGRLERCADPRHAAGTMPLVRTPAIDRLFVEEAGECLDHIQEGFAVLPPDAYGIKLAADEIARLAEPLELDGISALARRLVRLLTPLSGQPVDLEEGETRTAAQALTEELEKAVAAIGKV